METIIKDNKIYTTKDYNLFKTLKGNRNINVLNIKKLIESMKTKIIINPIIVNENYEIIDGQHRYEALKELNQPIMYIIQEGLGLAECQLMNCNSKNWSNVDFLEGYCELGLEDYKVLKRFIKKYDYISLQVAETMLSDTSAISGTIHDTFKKGTFKIKNLDKAEQYAEWMGDFKNYPPFGQKNFMMSLLHIFKNPKYDHVTMLNKLSYQNSKLQKEVNILTYIQSLSDIYNYKSREKVIFQ